MMPTVLSGVSNDSSAEACPPFPPPSLSQLTEQRPIWPPVTTKENRFTNVNQTYPQMLLTVCVVCACARVCVCYMGGPLQSL